MKQKRKPVLLSVAKRAARRATMARKVKRGQTVESVATKYGVRLHTVKQACLAAGVRVLTAHRLRRDKRTLAIIKAARNGKTRAEIAADLDVCTNTVREVCKVAGVKLPHLPSSGGSMSMLPIIAKLLKKPERAYKSIGDEFGVSRQYVEQVCIRAQAAGIPIPRRDGS